VKDCKAPTVVCLNGLAVNVMPTGFVSLFASDFLAYAEDNYTPTDRLKIGVRRPNGSFGFPQNADGSPSNELAFSCSDLGTQFVELWAKDVAGNADYCQTYVLVQDYAGVCE
jgi:hypothetical protein